VNVAAQSPATERAANKPVDTVREALVEGDLSIVKKEILDTLKQMGATVEQLNGSLAKKCRGWNTIEDLALADAKLVLDHLRGALKK